MDSKPCRQSLSTFIKRNATNGAQPSPAIVSAAKALFHKTSRSKKHNWEKGPLYVLLREHWQRYLESRQKNRDPKRGYLRPEIRNTFESFLQCGVLAHGVARFLCNTCGKQRLVPLSCRMRGLCSRCRQKNNAIWSEWVQSEVLPQVAYRQWVLSLPKCIRVFFRFDPTLKAKLSGIVFRVITDYIRIRFGRPDLIPLMITCDQSFGTLLDYSPHLHNLIADGGFTPEGKFVPLGKIPRRHQKELEELMRRRILTWLVRIGKISSTWAKNMRRWEHAGFSLHLETRIRADDRAGLGRLLNYMRRHPFSMRGIHYNPATQKIIYRASKIHGGKKRNFAIFTPTKFIAALSDHIPHRGKHEIRYYGAAHPQIRKRLFPNRSITKAVPVVEPLHIQKQGRRAWARWIWRIFEVDPLHCSCGGTLTLNAIVLNKESIRRILAHAGEPIETPIMASARSPPLRPSVCPSAEVPTGTRFPPHSNQTTSIWRTYENGDAPSLWEDAIDFIPSDEDLFLNPP